MNGQFLLPRLLRDFYRQDTYHIAQQLIGKYLYYHGHYGIITETEAYCGFDDPASHAYKGLTPRTSVMFGPPGFSYVYLIYGMYHCLNIVTEQEGFPAAVLIRGLIMLDPPLNLDGPGKLCRHLAITLKDNKLDLTTHPEFFVSEKGLKLPYNTTPRIGIKQGHDKLWRFVVPKAYF